MESRARQLSERPVLAWVLVTGSHQPALNTSTTSHKVCKTRRTYNATLFRKSGQDGKLSHGQLCLDLFVFFFFFFNEKVFNDVYTMYSTFNKQILREK